MTARRTVVAALAVLAISAPAVQAQDADLAPLLDRLERLERDIRTLNIQVSRGGAATGGGAPAPPVSGDTGPAGIARLDARISALENDLRSMTGQVEEIAYEVRQAANRIDKLVGDVDFRLNQLERRGAASGAPPPGGAAMSAAPSPPPVQAVRPGEAPPAQPGTLGTMTKSELQAYAPPTPAEAAEPAQAPAAAAAPEPPASPLPPGPPREQYAFAFDLLRKAQYGDAEAALQAFIERHPDEPLTANARYWLGETFYVRGDYAGAAEAFLDGYQKHRNGPKAPDSLLKLGMSLANLDKRQEACATFDEIGRAFPDASSRLRDRVARERQRAECP